MKKCLKNNNKLDFCPELALRKQRGAKKAGPYLVLELKPSFSPISASGSNFNPQNTPGIPVVKFLPSLTLKKS